MQVRTEVLQSQSLPNWHAVVDDMQIGALEVHDPATGGIRKPAGADVPLRRYDPVEHTCPRRDLADLQGNDLSHLLEALAQAGAGDAAADRKQVLHEPDHLRSG